MHKKYFALIALVSFASIAIATDTNFLSSKELDARQLYILNQDYEKVSKEASEISSHADLCFNVSYAAVGITALSFFLSDDYKWNTFGAGLIFAIGSGVIGTFVSNNAHTKRTDYFQEKSDLRKAMDNIRIAKN